MLYEFAILPDVFHPETMRKYPELKAILPALFRGLCQNGLVANLHKGAWQQHIIAALDQLPPYIAHDLRKMLTFLDKNERLTRCPRFKKGDPGNLDDWFSGVKDLDEQSPLHGIVVGSELYEEFMDSGCSLIEINHLLNSPQWYERKCSFRIRTEPTVYEKHLAPLLRHAKTVKLIDPFLNPCETDFVDTIRICCKLLNKRRGLDPSQERNGTIYIHSGDIREDQDVNDRLEEWQAILATLADDFKSHRYRFIVTLWEDRRHARGERFHDRYILTNQCGIAIQYGLRLKTGNTTLWNYLDAEDWDMEHQRFSDAGPFIKLGSIEVPARS